MVGPTGFEPVASRLSVGCSNQAKLRAQSFATGIGDLRMHVRYNKNQTIKYKFQLTFL